MLQHDLYLLVDHVQGTVCGKGHVIAITGIGNGMLLAPISQVYIKGFHHQIGKGRGCGCALGQSSLPTTQTCEQHPHLLRKIGAAKGTAVHLRKLDTAKKVGDIQL